MTKVTPWKRGRAGLEPRWSKPHPSALGAPSAEKRQPRLWEEEHGMFAWALENERTGMIPTWSVCDTREEAEEHLERLRKKRKKDWIVTQVWIPCKVEE